MIQINTSEIPSLRDNDRCLGSSASALILMKYGDYQCRKSGKAHQTITKIRELLGDRFCFVFRHFPQPELYPQSLKAAEIAEAAGAQGKFWDMHAVLFENQHALEDSNLIEYAANLELEVPQVLRELNEHLQICDRGECDR